jgi:hypothetical protein
MDTRIAVAMCILAALAACADKDAGELAASPAPVAEVAESAPAAPPPLIPAIIPPEEAADPTEPPSYEVALASAAATHNQALSRCAKQPQAVRTQCEQEANAAFADAREKMKDLRGNQE